MKQILRYSLVALLAMIVGNVYADTEVTFTLNDPDAITALGITLPEAGKGTKVEELNKDGVKIVATTAEGKTDTRIYQGSGGNAGKYDFRIYQGGTLTFTAGTNVVKKIVFTGNNLNKLSGDGYDTDTWTGSAASVTLTATGTATIYTITVTFGEASAVTVAAPTISGTTPFIGSTEVTITNNEEGAKIYYTTDGAEPTNNSLEYTAPLTITETTTVKAIAEKNGVSSSVASKTFTATPSVANVAALNALANGDVFAFAGEALVVYVNGKYAYIKDATGSSLIYDGSSNSPKLANLAVGKKIAANWTGKVSIYKNLFEAVPDAVLTVTEAAAEEVTYPEVAITDVKAENMNQVVVLKDVIYSAPEGKNFNITKEGIDIVVPGYNQFGIEIAAPEEGKTYHITGVISVYGETVQFQPIAIQEGTPAPKDVLLTVEPGSDISAVLEAALGGAEAKNIEIILAVGDFTITKPIVCSGNFEISGAKPSTIDASALDGPMVKMAASAETPTEITKIDNIIFSDLTIKGLKQPLFYSSQKNYDIAQFNITDCVIELAANATTIDFTKGSAARNVNVLNSTIYAPTATTNSFYSSQSGQKVTELDGDAIQTFTFKGNTMYNLAKGKNFFSHRQSNQKWLAYEVQNNIFVNCGKSGQVIKGMNGGQAGANPTWTIKGNAFNFDGADTSATESTGDDAEPVQDSVAGVMAFTDAANGDFNGIFTLGEKASKPETLGDPRWTITYEGGTTGISTAKVVELNGAAYNLAGQKVNKNFKGIVIVNGNKMIQK